MPPKTLLIVDDDEDDIFMIRSILKEITQEYTIEEAHNGRDALKFLQTSKATNQLPNLVIMDINMPIMDGKEALALIRGEDGYKELPLVVFTTSNNKIDKLFCERYNVEMLTKPPTFTELQEAVKRLLNLAKAD